MDKKVICDHVSVSCSKECSHSEPHNPKYDTYENDMGYCNKISSMCGYKRNEPYCICKEIKDVT